jgi:DNA-binding NarL/FixJ family response regulator
MTRVVVVEDHTLVRQSLIKTISAGLPGFEVVGEAGMGTEGLELIKKLKPDLVLLDIGIPGEDGLEVASQIRRHVPSTRIVFLTMYEDDASIRRAVGLGADGYLPKTVSTEELLQALRAVAEGGSYLSPRIARRVMTLVGARNAAPAHWLTDRELEILRLLAQASRPTEVAEKLYLSVKTVKNHLTSIYAKLGVETAAQAVAEAYRLGLVAPPGKR